MAQIRDVAAKAGVSPSTVSRALTHPDMVAAGTRARVEATAREMGYQPNLLARNLRRGGSQTIGLIVTDILNAFHATVAKGVQDAAFRHGFNVFLCNTDEDPAKERAYLNALAAYQLQGLVIVPTRKTRANLRSVTAFPIVEVDRTVKLPGVRTVASQNREGAREAVAYLIGLGHRRIGLITGKPMITTATERLAGYRDALLAAGLTLDPRLIASGNHREAGGNAAMRALMALPDDLRPSALLVGNNEMTAGAILATRELGLSIPRDISIIGFDDSRWARLMVPALTVVEQSTYELGYTACELLLQVIENRDQIGRPAARPQLEVRLPTRLIVRESCARYDAD